MTFRKFADHEGAEIFLATLRGADGSVASVMNWGAVLQDLQVPARDGMQRVVLGFPDFASYPVHSPHMGAIAGRFANRIGAGRFVLDGKVYQLPLNQNGAHTLHGGGKGFGKRSWSFVAVSEASVTLALVSPDGDHGFPGEIQVFCKYSLLAPSILRIELTATTNAPTVINLAHHSYFNLDGSSDILDHHLEVRANLMTPVGEGQIPNGTLAAVAGTPFDFRKSRPLRFCDTDGSRFAYDNNFMLRRERREESSAAGLEIAHAATLFSPVSGLSMECWTTEPALQVYDGGKMAPPVPGLNAERYGHNAGLCLEPQHVPDSPNLPHFPSSVLRPGELYRQVSEYRFRANG